MSFQRLNVRVKDPSIIFYAERRMRPLRRWWWRHHDEIGLTLWTVAWLVAATLFWINFVTVMQWLNGRIG